MVYLNRITTKTGDQGTTSLGDGSRVPKTDLRIVAIGSVDELNATIGLAVAAAAESELSSRILQQVQNDLFDAGAELCFPPTAESDSATGDQLGITSEYVERLERQAEQANASLTPLESFVLPGGSELAARLHLARSVCRRAERDVLRLAESSDVGTHLRQYLNRLSDLLFLLARLANDGGRSDVLWRPGSSQQTPAETDDSSTNG